MRIKREAVNVKNWVAAQQAENVLKNIFFCEKHAVLLTDFINLYFYLAPH